MELLPTVMGAYNATKHVTTGFSPSLLWFGREKRLPLGVLFPKSHSYPLTPKKYLQQMLDQSARIYAMTKNNTQQAQMRQKRNYDKATGFQKPHKEGDAVMVLLKVVPRGGVGKLLRAWRGPYKIAKVCQDGRWYILNNGMVTHYERLKPYNFRVTELDVEEDGSPLVIAEEEKAEEVVKEVDEVPPDSPVEEDTWSDSTYEAESKENDEEEPEQPTPEVQDRIDRAGRVLSPRARVDYHRLANPEEHILMKIDRADELGEKGQDDYQQEEEDQELMREYQRRFWREDELNMINREEEEATMATEERPPGRRHG